MCLCVLGSCFLFFALLLSFFAHEPCQQWPIAAGNPLYTCPSFWSITNADVLYIHAQTQKVPQWLHKLARHPPTVAWFAFLLVFSNSTLVKYATSSATKPIPNGTNSIPLFQDPSASTNRPSRNCAARGAVCPYTAVPSSPDRPEADATSSEMGNAPLVVEPDLPYMVADGPPPPGVPGVRQPNWAAELNPGWVVTNYDSLRTRQDPRLLWG